MDLIENASLREGDRKESGKKGRDGRDVSSDLILSASPAIPVRLLNPKMELSKETHDPFELPKNDIPHRDRTGVLDF